MNKCIFCNQVLKKENVSIEHIIPQCMGGRLKSKNIVCRRCNSMFGTEFDESLINRYSLILHPIRLFNEKLKIKDAIVEQDGRRYLLTKNGIKLKDPTPATGTGGFSDMIFPSTKSLKKHLQGKKKKNPIINIQQIIDNSKIERFEIKKPFNFTIDRIDNKVYRCCGKIVYEYLFYKRPDYQPSNELFSRFVLGDIKPSKFPICEWYSNISFLENAEKSIYHIIVLEGRKEDRILVGYLRGFNCLETLMILDRDYKGPSFVEGYYQDMLNHTHGSFTPSKKIPLDSKHIKKLIDNFNQLDVIDDYGKRLFHALDLSRILPIKKELEILYEILQSKFKSPGIKLSTYAYEKLILILDKYGLYLALKDSLDKIVEEYEDFSLLMKIEMVFTYLIHYFAKIEINIEVFQKIARMIFDEKIREK